MQPTKKRDNPNSSANSDPIAARPLTPAQRVLVVLPVALIATCSLVFAVGARALGPSAGYITGFLFYWIVWCFVVPFAVTRRQGRRLVDLFHVHRPRGGLWIIPILLLLTTTVLVPLFMTFLPMLAKTALPVILLSIPLATLHGFLEETFWRGLYIASFPGRPLLACALPTAFFALWHLAPQVALPADAPWLFVLATLPLGAVYASTAYTTRSALPSAIAHSVSGIFAFSGYLAPAMLSVL